MSFESPEPDPSLCKTCSISTAIHPPLQQVLTPLHIPSPATVSTHPPSRPMHPKHSYSPFPQHALEKATPHDPRYIPQPGSPIKEPIIETGYDGAPWTIDLHSILRIPSFLISGVRKLPGFGACVWRACVWRACVWWGNADLKKEREGLEGYGRVRTVILVGRGGGNRVRVVVVRAQSWRNVEYERDFMRGGGVSRCGDTIRH